MSTAIEKICSKFLGKWIFLKIESYCIAGTVDFYFVEDGGEQGIVVLRGGTKIFLEERRGRLEIVGIKNKIGKIIQLQGCKFFLSPEGKCEKIFPSSFVNVIGNPLEVI